MVGGLEVWHSACNWGTRVRFPVDDQPFRAQNNLLIRKFIYKTYIVYTDASNDACGAQLSQEHNGTEFPVAFLSHTCNETQCKWSTTEQEAFGVYYTITKWNYFLQGANIIVQNDHKPLAQFLNGKNTNNKVNRWSLELATYNITFKWISGAKNKAADYLSRLVSPTGTSINMLTASLNNRPAFHTRSHTQRISDPTSAPPVVPQTAPYLRMILPHWNH